MKPTHVYASNRASGWTRIEMLVALYDAALDNLHAFERAKQEGDKIAASASRLRAARIIAGLRGGLDLKQGELPRQIDRLCEFALHALFSEQAQRVAVAARVLRRLRDSFAAIQNDAIAMEERGEIAPLADDRHLEVFA